MIIQKNYHHVIFSLIIFLTILFMVLGWSSKYEWGKTLWGSIILACFLLDSVFTKKIHSNFYIMLPLLLFLLVGAAGLLSSVYLYASIVSLVSWALVVITFYLVIQYLSDSKRISIFITVFLLSGFVVTVNGFINFFRLDDLYGLGIASTFGWRNTYAGFLLLLLPLSLTLFLTTKQKWQMYGLGVITTFAIINLYFSFSQAAWLSFIIIIPILAYALYKKITLKQFILKIIPVIIVCVMVIPVLTTLHDEFITSVTTEVQQTQDATSVAPISFLYRYYYWKSSLDIIKAYPLSGIGLGNFSTMYTHFQYNSWTRAHSPHNILLLIAAETGILGLVSFVSFLILLFIKLLWYLYKNRKKTTTSLFITHTPKDSGRYFLVLGITVSLIASFLHALIDVDWDIPSILFLWFMLAGIGYTLTLNQDQDKIILPSPMAPLKKIAALIPIAMMAYILFTITLTDTYAKKAKNSMNVLYGGTQQAIVYYEKAIRLLPFNADSYNGLSSAYWNAVLDGFGEKDKNKKLVLQNAKKATLLDPKNGERHFLLGWAYIYSASQKAEFNKETTTSFETAISLAPFDRPEYYLVLAGSYIKNSNVQKARETIKQALIIFSENNIERTILDAKGKDEIRYNIKQLNALLNALN